MDARTTPDRNSVTAARKDIETSTVEVKDEMLTELLCRMYPMRVSQDSLPPPPTAGPHQEPRRMAGLYSLPRRRSGGT
jgi:hypothetical protein